MSSGRFGRFGAAESRDDRQTTNDRQEGNAGRFGGSRFGNRDQESAGASQNSFDNDRSKNNRFDSRESTEDRGGSKRFGQDRGSFSRDADSWNDFARDRQDSDSGGGRFSKGASSGERFSSDRGGAGRFGHTNREEGGFGRSDRDSRNDGNDTGGLNNRRNSRFDGGDRQERSEDQERRGEGLRGGRGFRQDQSDRDGENSQRRDRDRDDRDRDNENAEGEKKPPVTYIPPEITDCDELRALHCEAGINFEKYVEVPVEASGVDIKPITSFESSGLHPKVMEIIPYMSYKTPTPIQKYAIPAIMKKTAVMACAQTGSGKTAAYLLPIISNLLYDDVQPAEVTGTSHPEVLVLCPTRELAQQVEKYSKLYSKAAGYKSLAVYGQTSVSHMGNCLRRGVNIVGATLGRLKQAIEMGALVLDKLQYMVLDEADRMLDLGFHREVEEVLANRAIPKDVILLMFSATFPSDVQQLARRHLPESYLFLATGIIGGACSDVQQTVVKCEDRVEKQETLERLLEERKELNGGKYEKTMVFCETKTDTDKIGLVLSINNIPSTTMHGDRLQQQREQALWDFQKGDKAVLVCTNVAARGLDIKNVAHVINFDMPKTQEDMDDYIHRIGRTGRVGNRGLATTFYVPSQNNQLVPRLIEIMTASGSRPPAWLYEEAGMTAPEGQDEELANRKFAFGAVDRRNEPEIPPPAPVTSRPPRFGLGESDENSKTSEDVRSRFDVGDADSGSKAADNNDGRIPCRWETHQKPSIGTGSNQRFGLNENTDENKSSSGRFGGGDQNQEANRGRFGNRREEEETGRFGGRRQEEETKNHQDRSREETPRGFNKRFG